MSGQAAPAQPPAPPGAAPAPRPPPSHPKTYRAGTHRGRSPAETLSGLRPLLPVFGITRVANVTGLDAIGIPVVAVIRPNSRSVSVAQGKGADLDAAKASGVMEAIEAYHAENVTSPLRLASYNDLRFRQRVVSPDTLPRIAGGGFDPRKRILWIEGEDLLNGEPIWVPYEVVHTDYTLPLPPSSGAFSMSSNGLASGNSLLEAISHGICEVVERDATSLWRQLDADAQSATRVDTSTVTDPICRDLLASLERADVAVAVWETTSDVGLPSFRCMIADGCARPDRPLYASTGSGCHIAPEVALCRALTEAAQTRLTLIAGARDDLTRAMYEDLRDPSAHRRALAMMTRSVPVRPFLQLSAGTTITFEDDVAWQLARLRACGIGQVIVVNLTKPEFRVPVVRLIVPGLEGIDDAPGAVPGPRAERHRTVHA